MLAERLSAQLLAREQAAGPIEVAEHLLAVQAQDPRGARLAVRARTSGLTRADVDRALGEERSLVITWLNRGTLHLVRSEDYAWLHALTTPQLATGVARRLRQEGVSPAAAERAVDVVERSLADEGPLTRAQLRERIESAGVPVPGQGLVQILFLASLRGLIVRGPMAGREQAFVLERDWLGESAPVDRETALAELARRFLVGHSPADERDLARWAGVTLRDARAGLAAIARQLVERDDGLLELHGRAGPAELPPPRLLGAFDPLLMGWVSREPVLGSADSQVVVSGGIFRPIALVRGRAVALWRIERGRVKLGARFGRIAGTELAALEREAADVERFLAAG